MKTLVKLLLATLVIIGTHAEANPYPYRGDGYTPLRPNYQDIGPAKLLATGIKRMREFLAQHGTDDPAKLYRFLETEIIPYFDFERMAAWVAKPHYERMAENQKTGFRSRLQEVFLKTLANQIGMFSKPQPRIDFLRPRRSGPNEMVASARVLPVKGYPVRLTFRFWKGPQGWKVIDASANGTSAVRYYRQQFIERARRSGRRPFGR
ncbi:MAG: ABC transporter substrate-binding protein [Pseudomonadota bacterium]